MSENLQKILEIFYQICKIPHPSGQTKDLQKFIVDFLRACECEVKSDSAGNIYALKGAPKLIFQAHYDMVLVGDEVVPFIENGFLKSRNSSLGADNGAAVATLLHLAKTRKNIEILLTNDEEIGMLGANNLALQTHSKKMINLDSECVEEICVGCAGGFDVDIDLNLLNSSLGASFALGGNFGEQQTHKSSFIPKISSKYKTSTANTRICDLDSATRVKIAESSDKIKLKKPLKSFCYFWLLPKVESPLPLNSNLPNNADSAIYEFSAQNFKGGHSGIDIDKNIKNAIVELLYALDSARQMGEFEILEISGGEARNSIPINARAIIATKTPINPTKTAESAPHIAIKKLAHYTPKQKYLKGAVIPYLLRLHNGIYEMENGSVTSSLNFSIISSEVLKIMVRGNKAECLERQILRLRYLFGEAVKISGFYNAWEANSASCGDFSRFCSPRFLDEPSVLSASLASQKRKNSSTILEFTSCKNAESALDSADSQNLGENQAKSAESTLLSTLSHIYTKHKIPFKIIQIHAGLECGILKEKCALDEVISIGPTILHPHSKGEMMDLASFARFCAIVEDLCEA